ncbi:MAG: alpha-rhamnosidase [Prevotella sp.]|nr:alpha-rhamnosidase [Prevotella sp.]
MAEANSSLFTIHSSLPTWIWYPGDFEIWLGNIFNNRRTERGAMFPPFWKQDSHYVTVEFSKAISLQKAETITIACEGQFNLALDGKLQFGQPETFEVPAGEHKLNLKVWNQATPPALFIDGETIKTDSTWLATYEDKLWIDENGVAHGSGIYVPAAHWNFDSIDTPPSTYQLERKELRPVSCDNIAANGTLYDFGRETFGYLKVKGLKGCVRIYYGESREEALDKEHCETLDVLSHLSARPSGRFAPSGQRPLTSHLSSKAFRYVYIEKEEGANYDEVMMDYEFAPHDINHSGSFRCSDEEINRIWEVSAYTMDLTTREFFMDGIKRDRWTWSGDAIQSYLMNYYLRFDTECVKRTIRQLRGKDPVTAHVNTIMDYTFYWFKSVLDYYQYTGDADFVREMWPRMETLMDYVLSRTNADGMAEGQPDDWIFVDWVDFPMHKRGTLCFEQILFCKALETMALCAKVLGINKSDYRVKAEELRNKIYQTFWSYEDKAYLHAIEDGVMNRQITKFPNMFAIIYGMAYEEQRREIMKSVMLNPKVDPITTPYMRFYELEALCIDGLHTQVLQEMRDYWGGMLREGATSFWEKYVPTETGTQHLAMYGRPYGKSLCHAWGASPVYLLGKYYLGVKPTKPGYEEYEVRPALGDLEWMKGDVPTPHGMIHVEMDQKQIKICATEGRGTLYYKDQQVDIEPNQEVVVSLS